MQILKGRKHEIVYLYRFALKNGGEKEFNVRLDAENLNLVTMEKGPFPEWADLEFYKCLNCPVDKDQVRYCPAAIYLVGLVDLFREYHSYEEVNVTIETTDRTYVKHTTLHEGLSSLIGIYMVTSGCPILEKLKPMVRFHLPFATDEETKYRVMSMYLLAQYFISENGGEPDWKMDSLKDLYEDIRVVNMCFKNRLMNVSVKDASLNALIKLDCFAWSVLSALDQNSLNDINKLFGAYLR